MNTKLVDSLVMVIQSLAPIERRLLQEKIQELPTSDEVKESNEFLSTEEHFPTQIKWGESPSYSNQSLSDEDVSIIKNFEELDARTRSALANISMKLESILPRKIWENLWLLSQKGDSQEWQGIADLIVRSCLDYQYRITTKKLTKQIDSQWLNTLETEEDLLNAAVELTKNE